MAAHTLLRFCVRVARGRGGAAWYRGSGSCRILLQLQGVVLQGAASQYVGSWSQWVGQPTLARSPGRWLGVALLLGQLVVGEIDGSVEMQLQVGGQVP